MIEGEWSPFDVGERLRELAGPERVRIVGGLCDPFDTKRSLDELDELIEGHGVVGLKLYPFDWDSRQKEMRELLFTDEDLIFPLIERVRKHGLKSISIHKAFGHLVQAFGVGDMDHALTAFPDMQFEIVHGGWAFLDDTAILAARSNVWINLEGTVTLLARAPRKFAEILGRFLQRGSGAANAEDRVLWGSGLMGLHPQPLLELFWDFEMPRDLVEEYGYPELTVELKRKILGENYARKFGLDLNQMIADIPDDDLRKQQLSGNLAEPWIGVPPAAELEIPEGSGDTWGGAGGYDVVAGRANNQFVG
jgi:predicted TIM-barrel fold metal-dependent hydrolase